VWRQASARTSAATAWPARLKELGFDVDRAVVPDEQVQIEQT